ncbi:MAG: DUF4139 domain-containing protein [Armatimonadota bacterium]
MKNRFAFLVIVSVLSIGSCFAEPSIGKPSNVALTIYNQNFALVKEDRDMTLDKGINLISVQDVAATIRPSTVAFKSKSDPNTVVVREQNYQYDLISNRTILNKSIGKKVILRRLLADKTEEVEGVVLSAGSQQEGYEGYYQGDVVIQTRDGIILDPSGEIQVYELPKGLVSRPTLMWKLESVKAGPQKTEISYLANQMTWIADYVATVDSNDKFVDLTGWVTLTNKSGTTFENASLNLMAGDVNVVQPDQAKLMGGMPGMPGGMDELSLDVPQFTEKSFFEYHLYTLAGTTTVMDKESKQISLMTADKIPAKKVYIYDGRKTWWGQYRNRKGYRPGDSYSVSANKKVNVFVEIKNSKENNLGMPLPKGTMRVYKQEGNANQQFIGEDTIDHTPKDEKVRLYLGDAFDIVGTHTRTGFTKISPTVTEESFQISLKNHKDAPVSIVIIEHQFGDWKITKSSHKSMKKDASTIEIPVDVPKNGEVKVTYTIRTS